MSECSFERLAMIGVGCGLEIVQDARPRELQTFEFLFVAELFRSFLAFAVMSLG